MTPTPSLRIVGFWILLLAGVCIWACAPRPSAPVTLAAARTTALEDRRVQLQRDRDQAATEASIESATAKHLTAANRPEEAAAHDLKAAIARARAEALTEALARNESAATKARTDFAAASSAAAVETARLADDARRAWDRRACWWAGAFGVGIGALAALFAPTIGLPMRSGAYLAVGGLAVAAYGESAWLILPLVGVTLVVWGAIAWHQRAALHVVTSPEAGGWPAAAAALPAHLRAELDNLNLKAQENLPAVRTILDHLLRKQKGA